MLVGRLAIARNLPLPSAARIKPTQSVRHRTITSTAILSKTAPARPAQSHPNFYRTHGRALFKCLTLAFLSYQVFYWSWVTLESETMKDQKRLEIKRLEEEVKLLGSGKGSHVLRADKGDGKRLLEEGGQNNAG